MLRLIPFSALLDDNGRFLIREYTVPGRYSNVLLCGLSEGKHPQVPHELEKVRKAILVFFINRELEVKDPLSSLP